MRSILLFANFIVALAVTSCNTTTKNEDEEASLEVTTPVTVTLISNGSINKVIHLMATSSYLKKNMVKSASTGYITKTYCMIGDYVKVGSPMFTVKTKEADALANFNKNNPGFAFNGEITINSPSSGIIAEMTKQANDYVAEGDQLCTIAEQSSLVFLLNVPFEQNKFTQIGINCEIKLPDSTHIQGVITSKLSAIDPVSQTQNFVIKPNTTLILPENLVAYVQVNEKTNSNTQIIDKNCVLTDETMENFWVMKLINDSIAIKVLVKTGIVTDQQIEILSPQFDLKDRLIQTGNYGLPDTARVNIIQP